MPPDLFNLLYKLREDEIEEENKMIENKDEEKKTGDGTNIPMMNEASLAALGDEFEELINSR